jgi:Flp pilus assembly pilin Flp
MPMARRFRAEKSGLGKFKWALLIAAVAVAAVMYVPQLSFVIAWLDRLGAELGKGAY